MEEIKDRRSFDRLLFSETTVVVSNYFWQYPLRYKFAHNFAKALLGKSYLHNLSASGSCILGSNRFKRGDNIRLIIKTPDFESIFIKGIVRWVSPETSNKMSYIGIQFRAFGNDKKYNSYDILKQLHIYAFQNVGPLKADESEDK